MTLAANMSDASTSVTRTLSLSRPVSESAVARLAEAEGVLAVRTADDRHLRVTYDVKRTGMAALERWAMTVGLVPSNHLLARMARAWGAFQDENLRNQAHIVHHCCSAPPDDAAYRH